VEDRLRSLGAAVRSLRQRMGLTQAALSERAGIDQAHLARIERGAKWPSLPVLYRLADALGVPVSVIVATSPATTQEDFLHLLDGLSDRQLRLLREIVLAVRRFG
jgi:transcriptional regulator with XRE-family HTH domain